MGKLRRNKKGSLVDLIYVAGGILTIALIVLIAFKVSTEFNDKIVKSEVVNRTDTGGRARTAYGKINDMYPGVINNSFLLFTFGLALVVLVMASMVRVHPMFLIFFIILLAIFIFICAVFSNIYIKVATEPQFASLATRLTMISTIMKFLPFIVGAIGCLLAIIMYKNWENG